MVTARSPAHVALGKAVRGLREERGLSQEALAAETDLDRTYVGGIERGERNPSFEALKRLADSLKVRVSELFERAGE
ncbi:MAG: helix-turn-helix transcriptional regulator [Solirubrobacterales bacterium]